MFTEVAEEKKAWKKEKTTFMNISVNEKMVESTVGMLWCKLYYGNSKGNMGNQ